MSPSLMAVEERQRPNVWQGRWTGMGEDGWLRRDRARVVDRISMFICAIYLLMYLFIAKTRWLHMSSQSCRTYRIQSLPTSHRIASHRSIQRLMPRFNGPCNPSIPPSTLSLFSFPVPSPYPTTFHFISFHPLQQPRLPNQLPKQPLLRDQLPGTPHLLHHPRIQDHNPIAIQNRIDPVRNRDDRALAELRRAERRLQQRVRLHVHRRRRLVEHQDVRRCQQCAR